MKLITNQYMLKKPQLMKVVKLTIIPIKQVLQLPAIRQPQSTKILNLSNVPLTLNEIGILKLGLSLPQHQNRTQPNSRTIFSSLPENYE